MKLNGFGGGAYQSLSINADLQSCVNLYPEAVESGQGKGDPVLYLTPGLSLFTTLPSSTGVRGMFVGEGRLFVAAGDQLYEVFENTTYATRGGIGNDERRVQMFANGTQLGICSSQFFYLDEGSGPGAQHYEGTTDVVEARQGALLDGYFIALDQIRADNAELRKYSPRRFHHSGLLNGTVWNGLAWASKEGYADQLNAIMTSHEDLWLFGSQTTEVWRNNYSAAPESFPWERDPSAYIHQGISAEFSHCRLAEGVAWLSGDPRGHTVAVHAQGYQPKRVSTHAIEQEWNSYARVTDAESFSYTDNGHHFWVINFHTANKTWVYDASTGLWHRRGWWNGASLDRHRARCHGYVWGRHLVGDWQNGKIYEMSTDFYSDAGTPIHWERTCPHTAEENKRHFFSRMELEMEKATGQTAILSWSNDGGKNFNAGLSASNGAAGETKTRLHWHRLGSARDRVFRFSGASTGKTALIDAYVNLQQGLH